ncbi:MAG: exodeoxyribonuclease III [Rhodanobacteraceae bacterium]
MILASWNINSLTVRLPHVERWCAAAAPDVLALQETKIVDEKFPAAAIEAIGYRCVWSGQKTYNGVALLARTPIEDVLRDIPDLDDPQRRILIATIGGVRVVNLYGVNGQAVGSEKYARKLDWYTRVTAFLAEEIVRHPRMVVMGDFNIAPDDRDVHDPAAWHEKILCSTPERDALQHMQALGLHDSLRLFTEDGGQYSWWDYRQAAFRRNLGLRIDLILASEALRADCRSAAIDVVPRRWERPSDHAPVTLEIANA